MSTKYLQPSSSGIRKPTDPGKENGQIINVPRYAQHGGFTGPSKIAESNVFRISKPGGGRG